MIMLSALELQLRTRTSLAFTGAVHAVSDGTTDDSVERVTLSEDLSARGRVDRLDGT